MRRSDFTPGQRSGAALTLVAFVLLLLGTTGAFEVAAAGCAGCPGCESGQCDDDGEHPLSSHHHCCATCCLAHASLALASSHAEPAPAGLGPLASALTPSVCDRSPDAPYRPPRA